MHLEISPEANAFIRNRGHELVVFGAPVMGAFAPSGLVVPAVTATPPMQSPADYETWGYGAITVHVDRHVAPLSGHLCVSVSRFLAWRFVNCEYLEEPNDDWAPVPNPLVKTACPSPTPAYP